jgi:hypothetical protein
MVSMKTDSTSRPRWFRLLVMTAWSAGVMGAYFLLTRHFDHFVQALPFVVLLACPLMHFFMHRHHGGHSQQKDPSHQHDR